MIRRRSPLVLVVIGLSLWLAVAAVHDLAGPLMLPLGQQVVWMLP